MVMMKSIVNLGYLLWEGGWGLPYKKDCGVLVGDFADPLRWITILFCGRVLKLFFTPKKVPILRQN